MKSLLSIALALILSNTILIAQNNIDLNTLPDVEDYIVTRTNAGADTVIIGLHGGPTNMLYEGDWEYFESIPTFSVVEMQQVQHLRPEIMTNSALTLMDAEMYNDTTVALLKKVVNHFNALDKKVVLIGHSFGAFLLPEYVDDYGIDDVIKVIPMSGRMNMNQEVVDAFAEGYYAGFVDGINLEFETEQASPDEWAGMKLQAAAGMNRYVDSLAAIDLSKLMYVYGTNDQAVGSLLPVEVDMLENNNATVLAIQGGSHDAPFFEENISQVLNFIREVIFVGIEDDNITAQVSLYPTLIENNFTIEVEKNGTLSLLQMDGKIVSRQNLSAGSHRIDVSDLSSGMYISSYFTIDREISSTRIMVK